METITQFFQSEHVIALLVAIAIFLITIGLVIKRWVGFSIALLLLLFSLAAGIVINNHDAFHLYADSQQSAQKDDFRKQMLQAVEDLQSEINSEKDNLRHVMNQVQDIFEQLDAQKQKLQQFIEETRERFKTDQSSLIPSEESSPSKA